MPLPLETRLAMIGLSHDEMTSDLRTVVSDWATRCEALTAYAKAHLDPYETPLSARVSPFGSVRPESGRGFTLEQDTRAGEAK